MHFSASENIDAPQETVFQEVTDFANFERQLRRAGGQIDRTGAPGPDCTWTGNVAFRGTTREIEAKVDKWAAPNGFTVLSHSGGLKVTADVTTVALSPTRTRLDILVDIKPQTLPARVLLQSARLFKHKANQRFKERVRAFAKSVSKRADSAI